MHNETISLIMVTLVKYQILCFYFIDFIIQVLYFKGLFQYRYSSQWCSQKNLCKVYMNSTRDVSDAEISWWEYQGLLSIAIADISNFFLILPSGYKTFLCTQSVYLQENPTRFVRIVGFVLNTWHGSRKVNYVSGCHYPSYGGIYMWLCSEFISRTLIFLTIVGQSFMITLHEKNTRNNLVINVITFNRI